MTICRLCRERTAVQTLILTRAGGTGGTVTHLCKTCARALIPEEDWSTFGLGWDGVTVATVDLYGPPRYARSTTDGRRT